VQVRFRLVDVFTEVPFAGNQLCVVPAPPAALRDYDMLAVAREIGFSETAFVTGSGGDRYAMRIFTPDGELPFAGHPTLGTAYTLVAEGLLTSPAVQTTTAGEVPVEIDLDRGSGWMRQLPATFGLPVSDRGAVAHAAGLGVADLIADLPIVAGGTGLDHLMVPVTDESAIRRAERNGAACRRVAEAAKAESLYLFAVRGPGDVVARMFDRGAGVGEDPATGSAAGPLGAYLADHGLAGMPGRVVIAQGEMVNRPSHLYVEVTGNSEERSIRVGGGVRIVGSGLFELPD
jgi:trans-2,3-dihydro-3-hydroxyanthranilate isomerase